MRVHETDVCLIKTATDVANFQLTIAHMLLQDTGVAPQAMEDLAERLEQVAVRLKRRAKSVRGERS